MAHLPARQSIMLIIRAQSTLAELPASANSRCQRNAFLSVEPNLFHALFLKLSYFFGCVFASCARKYTTKGDLRP
jgi:hypothetical protein